MANKIVEDVFREVEEAIAKMRRVIDQHEALQHDLVQHIKEAKPANPAEPPKKS